MLKETKKEKFSRRERLRYNGVVVGVSPRREQTNKEFSPHRNHTKKKIKCIKEPNV